ncbi:MAG: DUF1302 domain-containing protein, partial [Porticoccaceae bacterium]|nr:DUF1302 domain-containing protein [Porticoccaceae bacterium]
RLLPQEMLYMAYDFSDNTSAEAYYVWNWRRSQFLPVGSMFSPFDYLGQGFNPYLANPIFDKRGSDKPDRGGQWGLALHHILEDYNDMDFGVYWVRSHAFQPFLQANVDPASLTGFSYHEAFAEDQDTYAVSLNGEIGDTGISFQSEVNLKENFWDTRQCQNFFGLVGTPTYPDIGGVDGCEASESNVYTWLGNLTYSIGGGPFGADKQSYLFDWAGVWIDGLNQGDPTDKADARLALKAPGVDQLDRFITDFAWGYTIVAAYEYNNVFWAVNVKPTFVWVHNVEGYTPFNNTALVENQRTVKVGVTFDYQSQMSLELAATWWPGKEGTWSDRDNVSAIFKYSF